MAITSTTRSVALTPGASPPDAVTKHHLPIGALVAGTYRVEGILGEGAGGVVYRTMHVDLGREFAVKVLRAEAEADATWRFVQEAKIASSLAHPNIVDVVHLGRDEAGRHFVVMELLIGEDLQRRLQYVGDERLPLAEVRSTLEAVLEGVGAAHEAGVVHRDLKPANIFLADKRGRREVKVLDFGMSRTLDADMHVTRTGELVGTPLYMAPEQSKEAAVDARADVYSLGVVAYEMLSGRVPFPAETLYACVLSHALQPPPPLESVRPQLPREVVQVVHRSLAKDPSERFADAREFRRAWSDAWVDTGAQCEPERPPIGAVERVDAPSELAVHAPPRRGGETPVGSRRAALFLIAVLAVGATLGVLGWLRSVDSASSIGATPAAATLASEEVVAQAQEPSEAPVPTLPSPSEPRRQTLASVPAGASVVDARGTVLGVTPLELSPSPRPLRLELRLAGHVSAPVVVHDHSPDQLEVSLERSTPSARRTRVPALPALAPR